ncbi:TPA: dGTPase [Acinetobacter baumannii]|uniref:dGTPase family protein n=1 Tax=Acinetobacter baumannii (strain 1295743) TaxID=1310613 RepID=A0A009HRD1_ACIB9|nr:dGTPase [Acinetobacter baumannii]EXB06772.1 dGTPase family protein [Acinetobacter baumannii 1295743]MCZ3063225.1 dGTPase [Acinetobacter baumannii]MDC4518665.1 dGTPase [Acinetobacter baumannii]MDC4579489.1 dGTPase [Acinetobacter baumannii]MDC4662620.1 dGTPase [Acinetobacter baumannii]
MTLSQEKINQLFSYLKTERLKPASRQDMNILEATESDRGRVINSAAFRRLQQKAQVFPLEANASVRSRLTHSFEVSQIGRYIAQSIIKNLEEAKTDDGKQIKLPPYETITAFVSTVETACLLHDIGNPPFGHLGEAAIQQWFTKLKSEFQISSNDLPSDDFSKIIETDLSKFDGNPQGFRIVRLLSGNEEHGLNLTCTLLLSIVKYPYTVDSIKGGKKIGLFKTCLSSYEEACSTIGWIKGKPFPYMQIMDIADEIAYSMSDLEDAIEKKIITEDKLLSDFKDFCAKKENNIKVDEVFSYSLTEFEERKFLAFKTSIIHKAVKEVAKNYSDQLENILEGEKVELFKSDSSIKLLLDRVKEYAISDIYSHESAEKIELAGRNIIQGLLRHYETLLRLPYSKFSALVDGKNIDGKTPKKLGLDFELRLFRRLPSKQVEKYKINKDKEPNLELIHRAHLIVDYISGMTDDFALEMFQLLEGIRIQ